MARKVQVNLIAGIYIMEKMGIRMKKDKGFTLIEVIVVMALIAIMAGIAIPAINRWAPNYRLKGAARDLYSYMQQARGTAVKTNAATTMSFTAGTGTPCEGGSYIFTDGNGNNIANVTIGKGVCLSPTSTFPSGFNPDGTASGVVGSIVLSHTSSTRIYTLTQSIAGAISLK